MFKARRAGTFRLYQESWGHTQLSHCEDKNPEVEWLRRLLSSNPHQGWERQDVVAEENWHQRQADSGSGPSGGEISDSFLVPLGTRHPYV